MKLTTKHGTIEATIEPGTKAVMVSVSGGMDSATLLYMLCKQIRDNNLGIPVYTGTASYSSDRVATFHASLVVKHMRKEFPDITINPVYWTGEDYVGTNKSQLIETMYSDIRIKNNWTQQEFKLWWGVTANPMDDSFKFVEPEGHYMVPREPDHSPSKPRYGKHYTNPFALIDKRSVVAAQLEYGLFECYTTITNSCTSLTEYQCNTCWWCQERRWAIKQVAPDNLIVPVGGDPLKYYQVHHGIRPEWRAGVRWNKQAYQEHLEMIQKHPQEEDSIEWAKRYIEGQYHDGGIEQFAVGKGYIKYDVIKDEFSTNNGKGSGSQGPYEDLYHCWQWFADADVIECAKKLRFSQVTGHEE
tara:strand:- start:2504 stop:3574 length:1071 start_codon:yes stop_codon:yes gene_type:complete